MPEVEYEGKTFNVDEDGFIDDFTAWCPEWVELCKKEEGIDELNDEHWKVIDFLREDPKVDSMLGDIEAFLGRWIPCFEADGRTYLGGGVDAETDGAQHVGALGDDTAGSDRDSRALGVRLGYFF